MKDQHRNREEQEIFEKFERSELRPAPGADREKQMAVRAARNSLNKTRE